LVLGYKVNVRFNFRSRQTQVVTQISSAILFRVSLFNHVIIEKVLSQITNLQHVFSAKSLKRGQLPACPLPWLRAWLHFNYFKMLPQNYRGIFRVFSRVSCCNASLKKNSFGTDIICNLTRHCRLLPVRTELSVFLWHFSFDAHFLLNCYTWLNITSLLPQCTSNLARKLITESRFATKIKNKRMPCAGQRVLQRLPSFEVSCCNVIKIYCYPLIVTYWPALQWCVTCKDCVDNTMYLWLCVIYGIQKAFEGRTKTVMRPARQRLDHAAIKYHFCRRCFCLVRCLFQEIRNAKWFLEKCCVCLIVFLLSSD